jgi:hypothetical protein
MTTDKPTKPEVTGSDTSEKARNTVPGYGNQRESEAFESNQATKEERSDHPSPVPGYGDGQEDEAYQANQAIRQEHTDKKPSPADAMLSKRGAMPD